MAEISPQTGSQTFPLRVDRPLAPIAGNALGLLAAVAAGAGVTFLLAGGLGWRAVEGELTVRESIIAGSAAVLLGALCGMILLAPASARTPARFGLMVLASGTVRMMVSLACGVVIFFASPRPVHPYAFFGSLCASFLMCLIVETAWANAALRRGRRAGPGSNGSAEGTGAVIRSGAMAR